MVIFKTKYNWGPGLKKFLLGAAVFCATASAQAVEHSWYAKFGYSATEPDAGQYEQLLFDELGFENKFDLARGLGGTLGYQFNRFIAVEGGLLNWGESTVKEGYYYGNLEADGITGQFRSKATVSGYTGTVGVVLSTSVERPFSVGVKGGVHMWTVEEKFSAVNKGTQLVEVGDSGETAIVPFYEELIDYSRSTDGTDPYLGLLASYSEDNWTLSVEYTVFQTEFADPASTIFSVSTRF
ncbi:outer membrane beta-barrel protein [Microbulbifer sp. SA54]|uniref:outer membrane beta-barrel protein n=1 Tax=Microbulbifer sp. SA54 TaxID=3401577 RepID=UPI003AAABCCE